MKSLGLFLLPAVLFCGPGGTLAQIKVQEIKFIGASAFSIPTLLEDFQPLGFALRDTTRLQDGLSKLHEQYFAEGYLLFSVDSIRPAISADSSNTTLTLYMDEGPRLVVGRLILTGNSFLSGSDLTRNFDTRPGHLFDQSALQDDISRMLEIYNNSGFPLAKIKIDSVYVCKQKGSDSLGIALSVDEGKRFRIDAIKIEGNTKTKDYVIIRALRIPPDTYYDDSEIQLARTRLMKLGFFQSVSDPELFSSGDTTGLLIKVAEGNTSTFDGVIGYVPSQLGQSGYFTGMIDISMSNLFGTGRKFRAMWHQETKLTQELEVGYGEPYIFGYPINAEFDFSQRQQDSTSVTRNLSVTGVFMFGDNFNANLSIGDYSTTPLLNAANNYYVYESDVVNIGIGATYDTRNDLYSPTQGAMYQTQFQLGLKRIYGPSQLITSDTRLSSYNQHLSVDLSLFHEFLPRQILALGIHGEQVTGSVLDQNDMYRIGGTNTIRGYIENQFIATKAAWTNIEYRFSTGRESFFFVFLDAGYIYQQNDPIAGTPASSFSAYGYGVGAQVETGIGILKASYALGKGDSFTNGKIHFGIVNKF